MWLPSPETPRLNELMAALEELCAAYSYLHPSIQEEYEEMGLAPPLRRMAALSPEIREEVAKIKRRLNA